MITQEINHFRKNNHFSAKSSKFQFDNHLTSEDEEYVKTEQYSVYKIT